MNRLDAEVPACTSDSVFAAIELSSTAWVIALYLPTRRKISLARVASGDIDRLVEVLERARETSRVEGPFLNPPNLSQSIYKCGRQTGMDQQIPRTG